MVPTKIFIWVTPEENILGNNFLKKDFYFVRNFKFNFDIWLIIF